MAAMQSEGVINVLVLYKQRRRPLKLVGNDASLLNTEFKKVFEDVLDKGDVFFQVESKQWGGRFIDLTPDRKLSDNDVINAVPVESVAEKAVNLCRKVSKPSEEHRSLLSRLFPQSSKQAQAPNIFKPDLISLKPKLATRKTRSKPYKRWVIVIDSPIQNVPTAGVRRRLKREGREKKIEFSRCSSALQVKDQLHRNFPELHLENPTFWKCNGSNILEIVKVECNFPNGEELVNIASKESIYIVEDQVITVKDETSDSSESEQVQPKKRSKVDVEQVKTVSSSESDDGFDSYSIIDSWSEPIQVKERKTDDPVFSRADLVEQQNSAFLECLARDREKARVSNEKKEMAEHLQQLREQFCSEFANKPESGIQICIRSLSGASVKYTFHENSTLKDLYRFGFAFGEVEGSFVMFSTMPRQEIPFSDTNLSECVGITASVIVIEAAEGKVDPLSWPVGSHCKAGVTSNPVQENKKHWAAVLEIENKDRNTFLSSSTSSLVSTKHVINRENLFAEAIQLFRNQGTFRQKSLNISFAGELGVDLGGVARDFLSAFWEEAYVKFFDGSTLLRPVFHPSIQSDVLPILGAALSHGYLVTGFLPVRVAFPSLVAILKGPHVQIHASALRSCFVDYVSTVESSMLNTAMTTSQQASYPTDLKTRLDSFFYRYECREEPCPSNISKLINQVAKYEFLTKPMAPIAIMHSGIAVEQKEFWANKSLQSIFDLYNSLLTSPAKVLEMLVEPIFRNANEERVFGYLQQFIGNMNGENMQKFLRFVTGASVAVCAMITVEFNSLSGLARRPIAHTCLPMIELSICYDTYVEFAREFEKILAEEFYTWIFDSV